MVADPHKTPSIMIVLGYAGLLPFVVTALLMVRATWFGDGLQSAALGGFYVPYIFIAYSAVILSFMVINVVLSLFISATTAKAAILLPVFMVILSFDMICLLLISPTSKLRGVLNVL